MGRVPKGPRFRGLTEELDAECTSRGRPLRAGSASKFLEEDVVALAARLRITEAYALRTYFDDWPSRKADEIVTVLDQHAVGSSNTPARLVPATTVLRLNAALGQAVLFAGKNIGYGSDDQCVFVITFGGDATTGLALALLDHQDRGTVPVPGPVVAMAAEVLDRFASLLEHGTWLVRRLGEPAQDDPDPTRLSATVRADVALISP